MRTSNDQVGGSIPRSLSYMSCPMFKITALTLCFPWLHGHINMVSNAIVVKVVNSFSNYMYPPILAELTNDGTAITNRLSKRIVGLEFIITAVRVQTRASRIINLWRRRTNSTNKFSAIRRSIHLICVVQFTPTVAISPTTAAWRYVTRCIDHRQTRIDINCLMIEIAQMKNYFNPRTPRGGGYQPLAFFPCNFFDDSNRKNCLIVSVTRDGRHILTYVTSSWRCHVNRLRFNFFIFDSMLSLTYGTLPAVYYYYYYMSWRQMYMTVVKIHCFYHCLLIEITFDVDVIK